MAKAIWAVGVASAILAGALAVPALAQDAPAASQSQASAELADIIADYEAYASGVDPLTAGSEGDRAAMGRLPDNSREGELARRTPLGAFRDRLAGLDTSSLSSAERLNHALLSRSIALDLERIELDGGRLAFDSEGGPETYAGYMASSARIATRADAEAWVQRLDGLAAFYDNSLANARRGIETGMVQPRIVADRVATSTAVAAELTPETDPLMRPFEERPAAISEADWSSRRALAVARPAPQTDQADETDEDTSIGVPAPAYLRSLGR